MKMPQKRHPFKSNVFHKNLVSTLSEFFIDISYADVTLVSDDQIPLQAHRFVLSASSPVLKNLLLQTPSSHPLIYLRGIKQQELGSILQFMYFGEANITHSRINQFMSNARDLDIEQLSGSSVGGNSGLVIKEETDKDDPLENINNIANMDIPTVIKYEKSGVENNYENCEQQAPEWGSEKKRGNERCEDGKEILRKEFKSCCDQCSYRATTNAHLKQHQEAKHEGIKYFCDQCAYQSSHKRSLKRHTQAIHEGVKYSCDQCEYMATDRGHLRKHKLSIHDCVKYLCDHCDYRTKWQQDLKKHNKIKHSIV